jgi:hypothetical protein
MAFSNARRVTAVPRLEGEWLHDTFRPDRQAAALEGRAYSHSNDAGDLDEHVLRAL